MQTKLFVTINHLYGGQFTPQVLRDEVQSNLDGIGVDATVAVVVAREANEPSRLEQLEDYLDITMKDDDGSCQCLGDVTGRRLLAERSK